MAVLLAVTLHPVGLQLVAWIRDLYPLQGEILDQAQSFAQLLQTAPWPWLPYVLLGVLPALCEEVAFRGFVLSGLRHVGSKWWAIGLAAVFFGMAHTVIQQSIAAAALGAVIGYIAVQSGSLVPCILFHLTYNSLMFTTLKLPELVDSYPQLAALIHQPTPDQAVYQWPVVVACSLAALIPLIWFQRLPFQATKEERLNEARARQAHHPLLTGVTGSAES
jgi:sodium transport system permease protein